MYGHMLYWYAHSVLILPYEPLALLKTEANHAKTLLLGEKKKQNKNKNSFKSKQLNFAAPFTMVIT